MPEATKPTTPMTGISCHLGGMSESTMIDDPMIRAASTMAKTVRLLIWS